MSQRLVSVFTPFEDITDPRMERTRVHDLFELVVVALCGTIAGSDNWADIERFGNQRLSWLRTFLKLTEGVPSHDTFGRVFARLDPAQLAACIQQWAGKGPEKVSGTNGTVGLGPARRGSIDTRKEL